MTGEGIAAYDPKVWIAQSRAELLADSGLEPADLQRTVKRHRKLLNAKKIKHFAHNGVVVDERITEDHEAQSRAVELFYDVFGVKAPRAAAQQSASGVEVVIDPASGQVIVRAVSSTTGSAPRQHDAV